MVGSIVSYNTLFLIFFLVIIFFYLKNKDRNEKIFFIPLIIIAILVLTRIAVFIPLLNNIPPNAYNVFFLLMSLMLFLKTRLPKIILLIIAISTIFMIVQQPLFGTGLESKELTDDVLGILPKVEGNFIILSDYKHLPGGGIMTYGIINYNLSTSGGEYPQVARKELLEKGLMQALNFFSESGFKEDCSLLNSSLDILEAEVVISHDNYCEFLERCNLKKVVQNNRACLYKKI